MGVRKRRGDASVKVDQLRTQVAVAIRAAVKTGELSTIAAAQKTGVHRTEFSRLVNGHIRKFGLDRLIYVAVSLGIRCSLRLSPPRHQRQKPPAN
jgi:predicted XRE-type DNA-binding protein